MKEVTIKIKSAKIVNTDYKTGKKKNKTVGFDGSPTVTTNDMENLIHFNHISNMIHVMMGSRPVSSRYQSKYEKSSRLDDIIKSGLIHYDNVVKINYTTKKGEEKISYYNEFTQGNKPFYNSNRNGCGITASNGEKTQSFLTWSKIKEKALYSKQYVKALEVLNAFGEFINSKNVQKDYSLVDLLVIIREYEEWVNKLTQIKELSPITNFVFKLEKGGNSLTQIGSNNSPNRAALSNINAVTPKVSIDATIVLFLEDEDAVNLLNAKGISSFLDNGYAEIVKIEDISHYDEDTFEENIEEMLDNDYILINKLPHTKKHETEN